MKVPVDIRLFFAVRTMIHYHNQPTINQKINMINTLLTWVPLRKEEILLIASDYFEIDKEKLEKYLKYSIII